MKNTASPRILITGATGNIGTELVKYLNAKGVAYRAMVRSLAKVKEEPGSTGEYVSGDFNDEKSLATCLEGIEKAFLLTNSSEHAEAQQLRFVDVAQAAGVKHIVKLSQWAADANSPVRFLRYHAVVEQRIRESGMDFTFLRPNLFMQALLGFRQTIADKGQFFGAIAEARISLVDIRDIAAAAGKALTDTGHEGKTYDLTGPGALTHHEMADSLARALGKPVRFVDVPGVSLREMLVFAGFPEWQADGLVEDYAHYKRGEAEIVSSGVLEATGAQPRSFDTFAADYAGYFLG